MGMAEAKAAIDQTRLEQKTNAKIGEYMKGRGKLGYGIDSTAEITPKNPDGAFLTKRLEAEQKEITQALDTRFGNKGSALDTGFTNMLEVRNNAIRQKNNTSLNESAVNRMFGEFGKQKAFANVDTLREALSTDAGLEQARRFNRENVEKTRQGQASAQLASVSPIHAGSQFQSQSFSRA